MMKGHYNSPGMRRLKAHSDYENIVKRTLEEQRKAMEEVSANRNPGRDRSSRSADIYPVSHRVKS